MIIKERSSSENIKLLIALCLRMQHLKTDIHARYLESIVQYVLFNTKTLLQYLCLMCIKIHINSWLEY